MKYTITVEYNNLPGFHPVTVVVKNSQEQKEFSAATLKKALMQAVEYIEESAG